MEEPPPIVLPRRQTQPNSAAAFVENRVQVQGDDGKVVFSSQANSFMSKEMLKALESGNGKIWEEAKAECTKLFDAMEALQKAMPSQVQQNEPKIDVRKSNWKQFLGEVTKVSDQYRNLSGVPGPAQKLRSCLRKIAHKSKIFEGWLEILPEGDYGSSISGAFRLILKAVKNMENVRETIYEALSDIPEAMEEATGYLKIYGSSHFNTRLLEVTAKLYTHVLIALRRIVEYFTKNWLKRAAKALFRGDLYESDIKSGVANVTKFAHSLNQEASLCLHYRIDEIYSDIRSWTKRAEEKEKAAAQSSREDLLPELLNMFYRLLASNPSFDLRQGEYLLKPNEQSLGQGIYPPRMLTAYSPAASSISSLSPSPSPQPLPRRAARPRKGLTPKKLLEILDFDVQVPVEDISHCLSSMHIMGTAALDRAQWIIQSAQFRKWLSQPGQSGELLIQGNSDGFEFESPLSFLSAHLSSMLSPAEPAVIISYVCGMHNDLDNSRHNASGMLVSLISQLLSQRKDKGLQFDLSWVKKADRELLKGDDLKLLIRVFRKLVKQMPEKKVLFCVIDGISLYEISERKDETLQVFEMFQSLIRAETDVLFKLLLTSPEQSLYIHDYIDSDDILWVSDDVDGAGHGEWDASAGLEDFEESFG